jgi:hypothetical protein
MSLPCDGRLDEDFLRHGGNQLTGPGEEPAGGEAATGFRAGRFLNVEKPFIDSHGRMQPHGMVE